MKYTVMFLMIGFCSFGSSDSAICRDMTSFVSAADIFSLDNRIAVFSEKFCLSLK